MRIERLRIFEVRLHLVHSFQTSSHRKSGLTHLLVAATDTDGRTGWGEIASRPTRSTVRKPRVPHSRSPSTTWFCTPRLRLGHPARIGGVLAKIRGHEFTKAGFSGAAWDLHARTVDKPLASVLGGTRAEVVTGSHSHRTDHR